MSTLFQLNSNVKNLKEKLTEIASLWVEGDGVILLGETVAFAEWLFLYVDYDDNTDNQDENKPVHNPNEESYEEGIDWFALQTDIDNLNPETKAKLPLDTERLIILSDSEWVSLTKEYERVMTVSM